MLRRFFKLIAGSLLTLVGIAIVIEAIRFNQPAAMHSTSANGWDQISEFLLCVGVVVGGYGAYLAYSGWNPEAAAKFAEENRLPTPSPGTPGEGRGEGLSPSPLAGEGRGEGKKPAFSRSDIDWKSASSMVPFSDPTPFEDCGLTPHPNPLPQGERGQEQTSPSDIGVQP